MNHESLRQFIGTAALSERPNRLCCPCRPTGAVPKYVNFGRQTELLNDVLLACVDDPLHIRVGGYHVRNVRHGLIHGENREQQHTENRHGNNHLNKGESVFSL
jgi:hypothetical protein